MQSQGDMKYWSDIIYPNWGEGGVNRELKQLSKQRNIQERKKIIKHPVKLPYNKIKGKSNLVWRTIFIF